MIGTTSWNLGFVSDRVGNRGLSIASEIVIVVCSTVDGLLADDVRVLVDRVVVATAADRVVVANVVDRVPIVNAVVPFDHEM